MTSNQHATTYGTISAAGVWNAILAIASHGPSWEVVPPILLACVAMMATVNTCLNDAARRKREAVSMPSPPPPPAPNTYDRCL